MCSGMPLRARTSATILAARLLSPSPPAPPPASTSPGAAAHESKLHCMKARPAVRPRRVASRPKESRTGTCARTANLPGPAGSLELTRPRREDTVEYTAPMSVSPAITSTWNSGSSSVGPALRKAACMARLAAGMTCPAPRCAGSLCTVASRTSKRTPRSCSLASTPEPHSSRKARLMLSLTAVRPCTPTLQSTSTLVGGMDTSSGPQAQMRRAVLLSHPCLLTSSRARLTSSSRGVISRSSSLRSSSSSMRLAVMTTRLCLFWLLAMRGGHSSGAAVMLSR
mmetsp:Transcript_73068/g.202499  ORF Transcript_73068/g.202499 Transcript_73068/m.202499 type:complete len:282 (-) Transcript_73068:47-892(-)